MALAVIMFAAQSCFFGGDESQWVMGGGEIATRIANIDIDWLDGMVDIIYDERATVKFFEDCDRPVSSDAALHHWFDGKTLHIRYGRYGARPEYANGKKLTILLPDEFRCDYFDLTGTSVSAYVDMDCEHVSIQTTSGDVRYSCINTPRDIGIQTNTGPIEVLLDPAAASFKLVMKTDGKMVSEFPMTPKEGYYLYGKGYTQIRLISNRGQIGVLQNVAQ